ncbi:MAG: tetraacyldisaccharide 4'-kinase [Ignavibacteriae bacterium]|nr:tetraacyldisaccharide 4'-kinase [Ignavibacteriota bacterium]
MRSWLLPFSWMYGAIILIRNWCYDRNIFQIERVGVPVIAVGNLTTGGTGKTPFVEYLLKFLLDSKKKVAILSRGYKRSTRGTIVVSNGKTLAGTAETVGDEPYQIARKFPTAIVIVDERRSRAAKIAVEHHKAEIILLDDGFQHRSLGRDIDIVMIDGRTPLRSIPLLPAGLRREPLAALRRADLIVLSWMTDSNAQSRTDKHYASLPSMSVRFMPKRLYQISTGTLIPLSEVYGKTCIGFCGIGNPQSFRKTLEEIGLTIKEFLIFPDHYTYVHTDLKNIMMRRENSHAQMIVTTEKDAVRLLSTPQLALGGSEVFHYVEIETEVVEGENRLYELLRTVL